MTVLVEPDAADDEIRRSTASDATLTPWACGLDADAPAGEADACADIMPELMVELI